MSRDDQRQADAPGAGEGPDRQLEKTLLPQAFEQHGPPRIWAKGPHRPAHQTIAAFRHASKRNGRECAVYVLMRCVEEIEGSVTDIPLRDHAAGPR